MKNLCTLLLVVGVLSCSNLKNDVADKIQSAEEMAFSDPDSALFLLSEIDKTEIRTDKIRANYDLVEIIAKDKLFIPHESPDTMLFVLEQYQRQNNDSRLALAYYYLARVYEDLQENENAFTSLLQAQKYAQDSRDYYHIGRIEQHLGHLYAGQHDLELAQSHYEAAITAFVDARDSLGLADTYEMLGRNHIIRQEYATALKLYEQARVIYTDLGDMESIVENTVAIAMIHCEGLNDPSLAIQLITDLHNWSDEAQLLEHSPFIGRTYFQLGDTRQAIQLLEKYLERKDEISQIEKAGIMALLSLYYEDIQDYRNAYEYLDQFSLLQDTLYEYDKANYLREIKEKYEKQELESEYRAFRQTMQYRIVIVILFAVVVAVLSLFVIKRRKKRIIELESEMECLNSEIADLQGIQKRFLIILDEQEGRLKDMLDYKIRYIQEIVDYLLLHENDPEKFKKKVRTAIIEAKKDEYFGELHEIVNSKFYGIADHLMSNHRSLSPDEITLCCLICFGFSNNQISILFGHTNSNSVFNKRHKLRRKLNLWPHYESLEEFISQTIETLKNQTEKTDKAD